MALEIYELRASFVAAGQHAQCVFHHKIDNTGNVDDFLVAGQFLNALPAGGGGTDWISKLRACYTNDAYLSFVSARRVAATGGNAATSQIDPATYPGLVSSDVHTQQLCGCIIWASAVEPENTGRSFLSAVPKTFLESSRWKAAAYTAYDAFIVKHLTGFSIAAGVLLPCIYDRVTKTGRNIAHGYLSPKPGTQRKREKPL